MIVGHCALQSLLYALRVHLHFYFHSYRNSNRCLDLYILGSRLNHLRYFILIERIFPSAGPECAGHLNAYRRHQILSLLHRRTGGELFFMNFISTFPRYTLLFHNAIRQYYVISELVRCEQHHYATMEERVNREKKKLHDNNNRVIDAASVNTPVHFSLFNYAERVLMRVRDGHECRIRSLRIKCSRLLNVILLFCDVAARRMAEQSRILFCFAKSDQTRIVLHLTRVGSCECV